MTDEELHDVLARLDMYAEQTKESGLRIPTFSDAASAIRQLMRERDEAVGFIRDTVHPDHRCEQFMSNPPKCVRSYSAKKFLVERNLTHPPTPS